MKRAYVRRLGFIRVFRYYHVHLRTRVVGMFDTFGLQVDAGQWTVQVAAYWWGFGRDGGS